jgi:hypothetical protein
MKNIQTIDDSDLGTVYVSEKAKSNSNSASSTPKTYLRKIMTEYKQIPPPESGTLFLKNMTDYDAVYIELQGIPLNINVSGITNRNYIVALRGLIKSSVTIPEEVVTSGYKSGSPAIIQVQEGQVVILTFTQVFNGNTTKILCEVDGETNEVVSGIRIAPSGQVYLPNADGVVTIPIAQLRSDLEALIENTKLECNKIAKGYADSAALYWDEE